MSFKSALCKPKPTASFKDHDFQVKIVENARGKEVFTQPSNNRKFEQAVDQLCADKKKTADDWSVIADADNEVRDQELVERGLPAVCATSVLTAVVQPPENFSLKKPIAVIYEYKNSDGKWVTHLVQVLYKIGDYAFLLNWMKENHEFRAAPFLHEIVREGHKSPSANVIFDDLMKNRNKGKEVTDKISNSYNDLFLTWSFIQLEPDTKIPEHGPSRTWIGDDGPIKVPFIRENGKVINDINMNLIPTTLRYEGALMEPIDEDFDVGMVPGLVCDFINGNMFGETKALVFRHSIISQGQGKSKAYHRGCRVRFVLSAGTHKNSCFDYIQKEFIPMWDDRIKFYLPNAVSVGKCIVNIPGYEIHETEKKINH